MDTIRGKKNKDFILTLLKDYLDPYFDNIEFDILLHQSATVFYIKDVIMKKDAFNRLGIPLLIRNGVVGEIKISIANLITMTPIELEIRGVNIEVNSIYLTQNYQSDYVSIKEQLLRKWENIHKAVFMKAKENTFFDNMIINCIREIKLKIKNFKFIILDNTTISADNKKIKKLALKINEITSYRKDPNDNDSSRIIQISKIASNIYKQKGEDTESINVGDPFIAPLNIEIEINCDLANLFKTTTVIDINLRNPLIVNVSKDKIQFVTNLAKYFAKAQKVQKYWQYRPEITKVNSRNEAIDVLRYAMRSVRDELRRKQNVNCESFLFEDAINIERYSQYYKNANSLRETRSIPKKTICELKQIERRMSLRNILHCRENVFNAMLKEEHSQCENNVSVNKWLLNSRNEKRIEEEFEEQIDQDANVLNNMNSPNESKLKLSANIYIKLIIVNICRKVKSELKGPYEIAEQIKYYRSMYTKASNDNFEKLNKSLHIFNWINQIESNANKADLLHEAIIEEMKQIANNEMQIANNNTEKSEDESSHSIRKTSGELIIPTIGRNQCANINNVNTNFITAKKNKNVNVSENDIFAELKEIYSKKILKKIMLSVVFTNISANVSHMRNNANKLEAKVLTFNIIDHNFAFTIANADNASLLYSHFERRFKNENFSIEELKFANEQEAFETIIINYLFDALNYAKIRNSILNDILREESEFLNQYEYQFKFANTNLLTNKSETLIANIFTNVLIKFLFAKKLLDKLTSMIQTRIDKHHSLSSLLTPDESNLRTSFIMRIAHKAISIQKGVEILNESEERNSNASSNFMRSSSMIFNKKLQDDLSCVFRVIYIDIIRYIIAPLIPYFIFESKTCDILYANLSSYAEITRKSFNSSEFINLKMFAKGFQDREDNTLNFALKREIQMNISNETIAEVSVMIPKMIDNDNEESVFCSGNIYEDLKITYIDVYDEFLNLRNEYFNGYKGKDDKDNELKYISERNDVIKKIEDKKFKVNININMIHINIFDKVFFISTNMCSSLNIKLKNITIFANDKINANDISHTHSQSSVKLAKILNMFFITRFAIESITAYIDITSPLFESDIQISIITAMWPNIYFLPDELIDMHSHSITLHLSPMLTKTIALVQDTQYFIKLYKKNYRIASLSRLTRRLRRVNRRSRAENVSQLVTYTKQIEKLLAFDENVFPLKYYLINRISSSLYYSVGKRSEKSNISGIYFNFSSSKNAGTFNMKNAKPIFTIHIPLLIYANSQSLFLEKTQLWIDAINTIEAKEKRFFHKLKATFTISQYSVHAIEFLLCKHLIRSIKQNGDTNDQCIIINAKTMFNCMSYCVEELNLVFSRISYYYEDALREQYTKIYDTSQNASSIKSSFENFAKSHLALNIERISIIFIANNNKDITEIISDYKSYSKLCENMRSNMHKLSDVHREKRDVNSNKKNNTEAENDNEIEDISQITFRKKSMHIVDFYIKKITLKILSDEDFAMKSFGVILYLRNINYCENKNENDTKREDKILNMFYLNSVKLFVSIPFNFNNEKDFADKDFVENKLKRVMLYDSQKMRKIFEKMKNAKNHIFLLKIRNIALSQTENKITFNINGEFTLGLIKRENENIKEKNENFFFAEIIALAKSSDVFVKNENHKEIDFSWIFSKNSISREIFAISNLLEISITKIKTQNKLFAQTMHHGLYMRRLKKEAKQIELFFSLLKMQKIFSAVMRQDFRYQTTLKTGGIILRISSDVFEYAYYLRNFINETKTKIAEKFTEEKKSVSVFNSVQNTVNTIVPSENRVRYMNSKEKEKKFIEKQTLKYSNSMFVPEKDNLSLYKSKTTFDTLENPISLFAINIGLFAIVFKQSENKQFVTFSQFALIDIEGNLTYSKHIDKEDTPLKMRVKSVKWKGDARCNDLLRECKNLSSKKETPNITANIYIYKPINDVTPFVKLNIQNIIFAFIFKCVKELILFFEFNSQCLDENPDKNLMDFMLIKDKSDNYIAEINVSNSSIIVPEDSQSANYLCLNISNGTIDVRRKDINPKIALSQSQSDKQPQIIDIKTIFITKTYQTPDEEFIPHTEAKIHAKKLKGFFCINKVKTFFCDIDELNVLFQAPSQDKELSLMRKRLWKEKFNCDVVTYKPHVDVTVKGEVKTTLDVVYSLKQFIDSNFDEESNIVFLREPNANFNGIEFNIFLPHVEGRMKNYKCYKETLDEDGVERIKDVIPGKKGVIEYNVMLEEKENKNEEKNETTKKLNFFKKLNKKLKNKELDESDVKEVENENSYDDIKDNNSNLHFSESSKSLSG